MANRAKSLIFQGTMVQFPGLPVMPDRYFPGVPARDHTEEEIALLSDEDYANMTGGPTPLYIDPEAEEKRLADEKEAAEKAKAKEEADARKKADAEKKAHGDKAKSNEGGAEKP